MVLPVNHNAGFDLAVIPESNQGDGFNSTEYEYYFKDRLLSIWAGQLTQQQYNDAYEATMFYYRPWPYIDDHPANREEYNKVSLCFNTTKEVYVSMQQSKSMISIDFNVTK